MAIDCRPVTRNKFADCWHVLFPSIIVINETDRTILIFCLCLNQNIILELYYITIIQREILNKKQTVKR